MRRLLVPLTLLAALALSVTALAAKREAPGHNKPTRELEAAFKVAQYERAGAADGCYLPPEQLAAKITQKTGQRILIVQGPKQVRQRDVVHILRGGSHCDRLRMALFHKKDLYVLDSKTGLLDVVGKRGKRRTTPKGQKGPLRALSLHQKAFSISEPEKPQRNTVTCPKGKFPLGGGMSAAPAPAADGEGAYPHSYERLGAQRGFHSNPVLIDPSPATSFPIPSGGTTPRTVKLQVMCAKGLVPDSSPHATVFTKSGETKSAIARCPKGQVLMSGGFQRTNFVRFGGNYITENRAISARAWKATATAFGSFGGELTAIAYCVREKKPILRSVASPTVPVGDKQLARATTPSCPKGTRLTSGGFALAGSNALFGDGVLTKQGTWTTTAFGYFGASPGLTAYGYCLKPGITK
jgi:hypothetical protein